MKVRRSALAVSMAVLVLAGCAPFHTIPSMPVGLATAPVSQQDAADALNRELWGIYAELPGQRRSSTRNGGTYLSWRWIRPGWVMEEVWHIKGMADPLNTFLLWRAEQPGVLYARGSGLMSLAWEGRVQPGGSVLFAGAGPLAGSYQVDLKPDGVLELRGADIQNGVLVSLSDLQPTDRYVKYDAAARADAARDTAAKSSASKPVSAASTVPSMAPAGTASQSQPRPSSATQAQAQAQAATPEAKARQEAAAKADEEAARAEARLKAAQQELAQAKTAAENAERSLQTLSAMQASTKPAPRSSKIGDFWTYCWYSVRNPYGKSTHTFVTNLINQRMWDGPFPQGSKQGEAEFDAYDGPNTTYRVKKRFEKAIVTSGLAPRHTAFSADCATYVSYASARSYYDEWRHENDPKPTYVVWKNLEDAHLEGSMRLPTPEEAEKIRREAQEAGKRLKAAQDAARQEEKLAALRKETAQRARDCAAGITRACGARGTKN